MITSLKLVSSCPYNRFYMITSITNQKIKNLIKLCQKSAERRAQNVFLVEGEKMFLETPRDQLKQVYISESYYNRKKHELNLAELTFEVISDKVFKAVSDTVTPQGILCVVQQFYYTLEHLLDDSCPCFLILEDIRDPGNLGTILRSAEGAGVTGVILSRGCVDIYNPKTIRSTMGSIYRVPFLYTDNLLEIVEEMKKRQIQVLAAHLQDSTDYDKLSYKNGTAFLIGNEGNGLSPAVSQSATKYIKIPMQGKVESLNAAVAASLLVYEVYRQRR